MALEAEYIEALNDCIERLKLGETLETILRDYPTMANDLRPMLVAGKLLPKAAYSSAEITAAQARVLPKVQAALDAGFGANLMGYWPVLGVVFILGIAVFIWQSSVANNEISSPTAEATEILVEATELPAEATDSVTIIAIEGAVEAINANVITIYGMDFTLEPSNPILNVIQIGDVVRIEGAYEGLVLIAVTIVFVDVEIVVQGNEVWRDSGNCENPPPPWAVANGWRRRCEGGGNVGNGNSRGRGGSS